MSQIDYQALREKAEKATCGVWSLEYGEERFDAGDALIHRDVVGYLPICRIEGAHPESGFDEDFQMEQQANAEFIAAFNPKVALALLDERERNQQYIKRRDQENEDIALMVGKLRVELEAAEKRIAEQQSAIIAPGIMRCAGCGFVLTKNSINMAAGTITAGDSKTEPCPNGCGPLWPVTWKEQALQMRDDSEQWFIELQQAKNRIAELEARAFNPAILDVIAERQRQQSVEGWMPEHDDEHCNGELAMAAVCYINETGTVNRNGGKPWGWPWDASWWKPNARRRNLVKAGALILAEIERIDRAAGIGKGE
ncbi:TPA: ead/Ea22-like family protein [Escherichia coli]|nr:ead/Ea22-like family protein [Escherichia coli]